PALASQLVSDATNYVAGVNAYIDKATNPIFTASLLPAEYAALGKLPQHWKLTDVIAEASLIGGIFGKGGGNEVHAALALQAFERRFGKRGGERAWTDFREANDPEAATTILKRRFPYETAPAFSPKGLALPDPGSVTFTKIGSPSAGGAADTASARGPLADLGAQL